MSEAFHYFAFISYSSKDMQYAEDLQAFLQGFKLPTIIREEYNLPETVTPIFRDVTDLPIEELQKVLRQELERSRFLILICSPNSASSAWVNREAEYFIELGRYDKIIPFIIAGCPGGGKKECFPGILRYPPEFWPNPHLDMNVAKDRVANQRIQNNLKAILADKEQLNGVSLDKEGEAHAHFRVLAKMLGLEPRALLEMEEVAEEIRKAREERAAKEAERKRPFGYCDDDWDDDDDDDD
ncbi:MAG: toll/interleukin-1 receptor domain-containing protein, partial [Planctomycetia bacterium]|nr:toll/interleukin-1 receptor domain-containing protein [Planctomycetia bacterium]